MTTQCLEFSKFDEFINGVINKNLFDDVKMYLDGYTTFLTTLKQYQNDIKNMRMNLLINYYCDNIINKKLSECDTPDYCLIDLEKSDYENYYKEHIKDNFKLEINKRIIYKKEDEEETPDEDTVLHYRDYFSRHLNYKFEKTYDDDDITVCSSEYDSNYCESYDDTYSQYSTSYDEYYEDYISEEEYY